PHGARDGDALTEQGAAIDQTVTCHEIGRGGTPSAMGCAHDALLTERRHMRPSQPPPPHAGEGRERVCCASALWLARLPAVGAASAARGRPQGLALHHPSLLFAMFITWFTVAAAFS